MSNKENHNHRNLLDIEDQQSMNTPQIFSDRLWLSTELDHYLKLLDKTNPAIFPFLDKRQKKIYADKIAYTQELINKQKELDKAEKKRYAEKNHIENLERCNALQKKLYPTQAAVHEEELDCHDCAAALSGIDIGRAISTIIMDFLDHKTAYIRTILSEINNVRLYWVWSGSMLSYVLKAIPDQFFNVAQARQGVAAPSTVTGYMSWILYYVRFGINLSLLLKHTIRGPWMSKEEAEIPWTERFTTQWDQRKFQLLNDSVWGLANMACFFWLVGDGMLGLAGNVLTAALLLFDLSLTVIRVWQEETEYNKTLLNISAQKNAISPEDIRWSELTKLEDSVKFDRKHKRFNAINDIAYALALFTAFVIMSGFFIAPVAPIVLAIVGASLCFLFSLAYSAVGAGLKIAKSVEERKIAKSSCLELLEEFSKESDEVIKKKLYLEMKGLMATSEHQKRMIAFYTIDLIRGVFIDAMAPPLIFVSLVFMPMGVGIGVLAAGFALAFLSKVLMRVLEPKMDELPAFNEEEYANFLGSNRTLADLMPVRPKNGFFQPDTPVEESGDEAFEKALRRV